MSEKDRGLWEAESLCMAVRKGEVPAGISEGILGSGKPRRKLLPWSRSETVSDALPPSMNFAIHEYLIAKGRYSRCVEPLREMLDGQGISPSLREIALARAGQAAMMYSIPLDLGPLVRALSLDTPTAARGSRTRPQHPLVAMEKDLLRALLLEDRSSWVESEDLSEGMASGVRSSLTSCLLAAGSLERYDPSVSSYHTLRIRLIMATSPLADPGDDTDDLSDLRGIAAESMERGFRPMAALAYQEYGKAEGSYDEARTALERSVTIASDLGNLTETARSRVLLLSRECEQLEGTSDWQDALISRSLEIARWSRDMKEEARDPYLEGMTEAALWSARSGDPRTSLQFLRELKAEVRDGKDEELISRIKAIAVLAHLRSGSRRKGIKALLDLINTRPVKNHPAAYRVLREAVSDQDWLRTDPRTRELFQDEIVYTIDPDALDEIIRRAKEAYPNEFGAMLRGIRHITHIEPVFEGAGGKTSFMFSMFSRFSQRNIDGEGVVHSHPSGSARPSSADLSMFSRFPGINIIIGYPYTRDSFAAYDRLGNRVRLEVVPTTGKPPHTRSRSPIASSDR